MSNLEKYNQIFMDTLDITENKLNEELSYGNFERWDSLGHITLISAIEDTFGIMFETDDILNYRSYENGKKILEKYGVKLEG